MLLPTLLACLAAAPQSVPLQSNAVTTMVNGDRPAFPARPGQMEFAPFLSGGQPVATTVAAVGLADFDGNLMPDLWFLAGQPQAGTVSVMMARELTSGRFRPWGNVAANGPPWTDGASIRSGGLDSDEVLLCSPQVAGLRRLYLDWGTPPPGGGDPRVTGGASFQVGAFRPGLLPDTGIFEVATGDHSGDGVEDVTILVDLGTSGVEVRKLRFGPGYGGHAFFGTVRAFSPLPLQRLRVLDWNGDGRSDVAAEIPNLGVVVACDDGVGGFLPVLFVPTRMIPVTDLVVGDLQGPNGCADSLGICIPQGVIFCRDNGGTSYTFLPAPVGGGPVHTGAVLGRDSCADLVAISGNGQCMAVQRYQRATRQAMLAETIVPDFPVLYAGAFAACGAFSGDVDGDGDTDLLLQHADGAHWYTVRNLGTSTAPSAWSVVHTGQLPVETGFWWETFVVQLPSNWNLVDFPQLELAVFLEQPSTEHQRLWDRQVKTIDPLTLRVTFDIMFQTLPGAVEDMHNDPEPHRTQFHHIGAMTAGGPTQLCFCGVGPGNPLWVQGLRRTEAMILGHDPIGDANKSAQGVYWERKPAPPLPKADDELLPWQ